MPGRSSPQLCVEPAYCPLAAKANPPAIAAGWNVAPINWALLLDGSRAVAEPS